MLGTNQVVSLKRETTKGTTIKPTKFVKNIEGSTINTKTNMQSIKTCEGKTFSPSLLTKSTVETVGNLDFFLDRENVLFFLNMLTNTPTATVNGDGTYTYSFDIMNSYDSPSYTIDISKGGVTQRSNGVVCSSLGLSIDDSVVKGSVEMIGLKSIYSTKVLSTSSRTITVGLDDSLLFVTGDKIVKSGEASLTTPSAVATVVSVNTTTGVITVGTGEGTPFAGLVGIAQGITLQKEVASYTSGVLPIKWYENATINFDGSEIAIDKLTLDLKVENEGRYLSGSNFANKINQKSRMMEVGFEVDAEFADSLLFKYNNGEKIAVEIYLEGENIGTGTAKSRVKVAGNIQIKEAPLDFKVDEFLVVPFKADFIDNITFEVISTISSL